MASQQFITDLFELCNGGELSFRALHRWWAQYMESTGDMEAAVRYYEKSQDFFSLVRVHCYCSDMQKVIRLHCMCLHVMRIRVFTVSE